MDFKQLFISSILISLVIVGILSFAINFQEENNVNDSLVDNKLINNSFASLKTNLNNGQTEAQSQKEVFESESPTAGFGSIVFFSIISSGKVFNNMVGKNMNLLIKIPVVVFGIDPVVLGALITILIFIIIIGLWIIYKVGG